MQTINLNQNSFRLFPTIYMVQNDTGRELKMILDDVTLAGTETGAVAIKRSDGSYYTIPATLVTGENAFTADMTQALTQPSMTECQLKITDENDLVVSSYTFHIKVQPSTDGISEEQLGYSVQDLMDAVNTILSDGISPALKAALLQLASKVAYIDDHGQEYYDDLDAALNPPANLVSISAVYTQSGTVYDTDSLDSLKTDLVVTAHYDNNTTETVDASDYTLSGSLTEGTSTITVTYEDKTTTFNVTVSHLDTSLYRLTNRTFNNDTPIDTGLKLLETDQTLTFLVDVDFAAQSTSVTWVMMKCMKATSPYPGLSIQQAQDAQKLRIQWMTGYSDIGYSGGSIRSYVGNVKLVIVHEAGSGEADYYLKIGNDNRVDGTITSSFTSINTDFAVGGNLSGTQTFAGTINSLEVYPEAYSSEQIDAFFGA